MSGYSKWLGGGLGWLVGGPIGGILGFVAGNILNEEPEAEVQGQHNQTSELESCMMVMASHIIHADGKVSLKEIDAVRNFFMEIGGGEHVESKMKVMNHCLNHEYELEKACGFVRIYQTEAIAIQCLRFLYGVAISDEKLSEKEYKLLFYIAGQLNINDVVFGKLMKEWTIAGNDDFGLFNLHETATVEEIRTVYRRMVLNIHPDRNPSYSDEERKEAERQLQLLREAYERLTGN